MAARPTEGSVKVVNESARKISSPRDAFLAGAARRRNQRRRSCRWNRGSGRAALIPSQRSAISRAGRHGRHQLDPAQAQRRPHLLREEAGRGKTHKEALRSLKRKISDAIFARLQADARQAAATQAKGPGRHPGNDSASSAASSHPARQLFGQDTPGPGTSLRPGTTTGTPSKRSRRKPRQPLDNQQQRGLVMHASMIISGPDLIAYRRNILCAGESVGTGIPDLLPRSAGPTHEVGVTSPAFPCISKREPPGHCSASSAGRTCPSCRWGVASQ